MASTEPTEAAEKQFAIQKLFVKDLSFESPNTPQIFTEKWDPAVDISLNSNAKKAPQDLFEVSITVTVTVKNNDKVAYLVEATQVGIFGVKGFSDSEIGPLLGSFCPSVLFPYYVKWFPSLSLKAAFHRCC